MQENNVVDMNVEDEDIFVSQIQMADFIEESELACKRAEVIAGIFMALNTSFSDDNILKYMSNCFLINSLDYLETLSSENKCTLEYLNVELEGIASEQLAEFTQSKPSTFAQSPLGEIAQGDKK
jgi:hypothetical protein